MTQQNAGKLPCFRGFHIAILVRGWKFLSVAFCLSCSDLPAQNATTLPSTSATILESGNSILEKTRPGDVIASVACDPFMTHSQERQLWAALQRHDSVPLESMTWDQLQGHLQQSMPTYVDRKSLEDLMLEFDNKIHLANPIPPGPLGARLTQLLSPQDMTFTIRHAQLVIESKDQANEGIAVRLYDVTPLVGSSHSGQRDVAFDCLMNLLQTMVEPDTWIDNGGCSRMEPWRFTGEPRSILALGAPTSVHLQAQCLLDRLNSATGDPANALPADTVDSEDAAKLRWLQLRTMQSEF